MKFAMNGALSIGTLDGANIELREAVGPENFFLFGLTAAEINAKRKAGYKPWEYYQNNPSLKLVIDRIASGLFSHGDPDLFQPIVNSLLSSDPYFLLADYQSYIDCQERVAAVYTNPKRWTKMSILNTARIGQFSSDRAVQEYCDEIWHVQPTNVDLSPLEVSSQVHA
jgi:starch phosphorylase